MTGTPNAPRRDVGTLNEKDRDRIPRSQFAYVDGSGEGHLPIHDEAHVRSAVARWSQTKFEDDGAREKARRKILSAARKHGIELSVDDKIMQGAPKKRTHSGTAARRKSDR